MNHDFCVIFFYGQMNRRILSVFLVNGFVFTNFNESPTAQYRLQLEVGDVKNCWIVVVNFQIVRIGNSPRAPWFLGFLFRWKYLDWVEISYFYRNFYFKKKYELHTFYIFWSSSAKYTYAHGELWMFNKSESVECSIQR